jgi:hypothetical protein
VAKQDRRWGPREGLIEKPLDDLGVNQAQGDLQDQQPAKDGNPPLLGAEIGM